MKSFPFSVATIVALAGCFSDRSIEGSGRLVDVQRNVAAFHAVAIADGLRAQIAIGPQEVALHVDDNIVDHVRVEVRGGVLFVEANADDLGFDPSGGAVVRIASPTIDAVSVFDGARAAGEARGDEVTASCNDGGELVLDVRAANILNARAHDASIIVLSGTAPIVDLESIDASRIHSRVPAETVGIRSHDASEVVARAAQGARVRASDASNVRVEGNPANRDVSSTDGSSVVFSD
jgi:hypothetical protein